MEPSKANPFIIDEDAVWAVIHDDPNFQINHFPVRESGLFLKWLGKACPERVPGRFRPLTEFCPRFRICVKFLYIPAIDLSKERQRVCKTHSGSWLVLLLITTYFFEISQYFSRQFLFCVNINLIDYSHLWKWGTKGRKEEEEEARRMPKEKAKRYVRTCVSHEKDTSISYST